MKQIRIKLLLLFVVSAMASLTFAGAASAGWTSDDTSGWTWTDDAPASAN